MTAYWIYCRLNVSVGRTDTEVLDALHAYADAHVKGGRASITQSIADAVLAEHADAQDLYSEMRF